MRKAFEIGGFVASAILVTFGIVAIVMGFNGRSTVQQSLKLEQIVGSDDMTPALIAADAKKAGLVGIDLPTVDIAGKTIDTGAEARAFAGYMRIHTLEASGGLTYAQMPRYASADGKGTSDETKALIGPTGKSVDNPIRALWVTETALTTALNTSFLAEQIALFSIVVGFALLLTGIGFFVLAFGGALRSREPAVAVDKKTAAAKGATTVPVA